MTIKDVDSNRYLRDIDTMICIWDNYKFNIFSYHIKFFRIEIIIITIMMMTVMNEDHDEGLDV